MIKSLQLTSLLHRKSDLVSKVDDKLLFIDESAVVLLRFLPVFSYLGVGVLVASGIDNPFFF